MNRAKMKAEARKLISGRLWDLWKPMLLIFLITSILGSGAKVLDPDGTSESVKVAVGIIELFLAPLTVGMIGYVLNFVRGKNASITDLFKYYKKLWPIILVTFLCTVFISLWTLLLIVPGIIAAIAYSKVTYLMADDEEIGYNTIMKSKKMMQGYKWDYVVFELSFILWILLVIVTFGIAIVYVAPYMTVSEAIYYEQLRKIKCKEV